MHLKILALLLMLIALDPVVAEVYKWVDSDGQVHYGFQPPDHVNRKQMRVDGEQSSGERSGRVSYETLKDEQDTSAGTEATKATTQNSNPKINQQCQNAKRILLTGVDNGIMSATEAYKAGKNSREGYEKGLENFKKVKHNTPELFSGCNNKYNNDAEYKKMVDCLNTVSHESLFNSCLPK